MPVACVVENARLEHKQSTSIQWGNSSTCKGGYLLSLWSCYWRQAGILTWLPLALLAQPTAEPLVLPFSCPDS